MAITTITPRELGTLQQPITLLDVRTPAEFQEVHVEFAKNVPLDQLEPAALGLMCDEPVYLICRSGGRGKQACERLEKAGFSKVFNVEGGTLACVDAGLPVMRGRAVMSLERQVRIAAGSLVLLGALLAWMVNPAFVALSGFVGAGLVFAGVTDSCGMGMILARMPWNCGCNSGVCK